MERFDLLIPYAANQYDGGSLVSTGGPPLTLDTARDIPAQHDLGIRVNDFAVKLANVNGTGSASANTLLVRAIFRHGHSRVGKRTCFRRTSRDYRPGMRSGSTRTGYTARAIDYDVMVTMNAQTLRRGHR